MTTASADGAEQRRRGGRSAKSERGPGPSQRPWQLHRRHIEPTRAVSDDELESIHLASLEVLSDIGVDFLHPTALAMWREAGARVEGERVRFDPELVLDLVAAAPQEFMMHAPDPRFDIRVGGDHVVFSSVGSAPNYSDRAGGRRTGSRETFQTLVKLCHSLNVVQLNGGYPVEPVDLHPAVRHLEATRDILTLSGKAVTAYSLGAQRNIDCLEMVRIVRGLSDDEVDT
ncbi:MAG: methyltransferase, partial [Actinomycetia bacterium]|nr:methyltransferase [Actinomycetes bacterium]